MDFTSRYHFDIQRVNIHSSHQPTTPWHEYPMIFNTYIINSIKVPTIKTLMIPISHSDFYPRTIKEDCQYITGYFIHTLRHSASKSYPTQAFSLLIPSIFIPLLTFPTITGLLIVKIPLAVTLLLRKIWFFASDLCFDLHSFPAFFLPRLRLQRFSPCTYQDLVHAWRYHASCSCFALPMSFTWCDYDSCELCQQSMKVDLVFSADPVLLIYHMCIMLNWQAHYIWSWFSSVCRQL